MLDLGFSELSMEPVVCAEGDPSALTEEDLPVVMEQYDKLAELMLQRDEEGKPFTFYHYMIDLTGGPCIYKRISGCGCDTEYMAVTPWGDLYPCHQFVGEERFRLGDIWEGVTNTAIQREFANCNVYAHPECRDCRARLYCSGGCAANAYHSTGSLTGFEPLDLTEIDGADSPFEAEGILRESEENAFRLFGAHTFYSTEGSSLCIRAMLQQVCQYARGKGKHPRILAGRNAHKTFLSAAALLDFDVQWLYSEENTSYLSCPLNARMPDGVLAQGEPPTALHVTSPDYLGFVADLSAPAEGYERKLAAFTAQVQTTKEHLRKAGFTLSGGEPLKLTPETRAYGYEGAELAAPLAQKQMFCEFCDRDYLVLMVTPETTVDGLKQLEDALLALPRKPALPDLTPAFCRCERVLSPRAVMLGACENLPVEQCVGRILASLSVGCPPAVPLCFAESGSPSRR